jgi:(S)-ureidoglycine aminohydrolase
MHELGVTRSAFCRDHLLQTPDTFVRAPLPGMRNATAVVHVAPAIGARFTQYTAEFEPGGILPTAIHQRFLYVLEGALEFPGHPLLEAGDFAYFPAGGGASLSSPQAARAAVLERPYEPLAGSPAPRFFMGRESECEPQPLMGDPDLQVRSLVPASAIYDFAVNIMTYQPGAGLSMVEIHLMEHGLLMLAGGGIYRLNDRWYPVQAGDFIWMAPYCPQWFGAIGKTPAKYLIYKDWNRHPGA